MRVRLLLILLAVVCAACPETPTAPTARTYCPFILSTRDTVYIVNGVPLRVIDTVRRCL